MSLLLDFFLGGFRIALDWRFWLAGHRDSSVNRFANEDLLRHDSENVKESSTASFISPLPVPGFARLLVSCSRGNGNSYRMYENSGR